MSLWRNKVSKHGAREDRQPNLAQDIPQKGLQRCASPLALVIMFLAFMFKFLVALFFFFYVSWTRQTGGCSSLYVQHKENASLQGYKQTLELVLVFLMLAWNTRRGKKKKKGICHHVLFINVSFLERDGRGIKQVCENQHTAVSSRSSAQRNALWIALFWPISSASLSLHSSSWSMWSNQEVLLKNTHPLKGLNISYITLDKHHPTPVLLKPSPSQPQQQGEACENANKVSRKDSLFSDHGLGEVCSFNLCSFFLFYVPPCWNLEITMCSYL